MGFIQPSATATFSLLPCYYNFVIIESFERILQHWKNWKKIHHESDNLTPWKKNKKIASLLYIGEVSNY